MADRIDRRTLNRTLLARQWLHPRVDATALEAVDHLVGLQAQSPSAPYVGLWSRLTSFTHDDLARLLLDHEVVRIVTLRSTVHLHTAADARPVRQWTQPVTENGLRTTRKQPWALIDRAELVTEVQRLLQDAPVSAHDLGVALQRRWPEVSAPDLHQFARALLFLVQVPPRGVWGRSGRTTYATADSWLSAPPEPLDVERLIARYLAAYGPASVRDVQAWSGLTRLGEVTSGMPLRRYVDDDGVELLDVDLPLADPDTVVPPVFTAPFDNVTLSHADRRRVIDDAGRKVVSASGNGMIPGMVLLDGFMAAIWRTEGDTLEIFPLRPLAQRVSRSLMRPGRELLRFLTGTGGEVRVADG